MSKKGGYQIIDLKGKALSGVATVIDGVYEAIEGNYYKRLVISGANVGGNIIPDFEPDTLKVVAGNFVIGYNGVEYTITDDDEVTITTGHNKTEIVKLWENAAPTSSFAAQLVSISGISAYDLICVTFRQSDSTDIRVQSLTENLKKGSVSIVDSGVIAQRSYEVKSTGVDFSGAYKASWTAITSGLIGNNAAAIPVVIYGIRGINE